MNKESIVLFLENIENVAASLDEVPDEMLPHLFDLAKQFEYLVRLEVEAREDAGSDRHPAQEYHDDQERDFISSL